MTTENRHRLFILGGGNIAIYLTNLANRYGFEVTVIDNDPQYADPAKFPNAREVIAADFAGCLDDKNIGPEDYICVMSRGHVFDPLILKELMKYPEPAYVGMLGGKSRTTMVLDEMEAKGEISRERRKHLNTPIGLWIGAGTPDEIALSIIAEIIGRKNGVI